MRDGNCRAGELYRHYACPCVSQLTQLSATTDAPAERAFRSHGRTEYCSARGGHVSGNASRRDRPTRGVTSPHPMLTGHGYE